MKVFTTGQVARICSVATRTVSKWFDSGRLKGYRIPGSQDRRIPREHLIRFLKEYGMPLGELEDEAWHRLLLVGVTIDVRRRLMDLLPVDDYRIESTMSGFDAVMRIEELHPDCIVIDFEMGHHEAAVTATTIRNHPENADKVLIALYTDDDMEYGFDREL